MADVEFAPDPEPDDDELISGRLANYVRAICRNNGVRFRRGMTRGEARVFIEQQKNERKTQWLSRGEVREVACPKCGAPSGKRCHDQGNGRQRERNHRERAQARARSDAG